jgi:hypothetical protein
MVADDPNRAMLRLVAEQLGSLRDEVVFVGGTTLGLLLTDEAAPSPRPTKDVDLVVRAGSPAAYHHELRPRLLRLGFTELIAPSAPICAWMVQGIRVDIMSIDASAFGFTNRWYVDAIRSPLEVGLEGIGIRVVSSVYFMATKLEAFLGRGGRDFYASHDLEDIVALVDGRPELVAEVAEEGGAVAEFIGATVADLLSEPDFINALPGHVVDPGRHRVVRERLVSLAT